MSAETLMLLSSNPRKRRRRMTAKQRKYFGKRRRNPVAVNPRKRRRRRRGNPVSSLAVVNPRRRRRNNPRGGDFMSLATDSLMPAATAAGGVMAVDMALGFLPLPIALKTGMVRNVTRAAGLVVLAMVAGNFASRETARAIVAGGLSIVMHDTLKGFAQQFFPQLPLGLAMTPADETLQALAYAGSGYNPDGYDDMGAYLDQPGDDVGAYLDQPGGGMGEGGEGMEYDE